MSENSINNNKKEYIMDNNQQNISDVNQEIFDNAWNIIDFVQKTMDVPGALAALGMSINLIMCVEEESSESYDEFIEHMKGDFLRLEHIKQ